MPMAPVLEDDNTRDMYVVTALVMATASPPMILIRFGSTSGEVWRLWLVVGWSVHKDTSTFPPFPEDA